LNFVSPSMAVTVIGLLALKISPKSFFFSCSCVLVAINQDTNMSRIIKFEGHQYFRQRLILSALSGRIIRIEKIRSNDENPGLRGS
jgi:hypothetical protein